LSVLVIDANAFSRELTGEILRNLDINCVSIANDADTAFAMLIERQIDVLLVSSDESHAFNALAFVQNLRRLPDHHSRRLPAILITPDRDRETAIMARDAGIDELLARPISPNALLQRLQMVIETPRPFVDSAEFLGPCRRRKNPADYHGPRRRAGERSAQRPALIDQDEIARQLPMRRSLTRLHAICADLPAARPETLGAAMEELKAARSIAAEQNDHALHARLTSFESCLAAAAPLGAVDTAMIDTALTTLEQLAALPTTYAKARDSVATAFGQAIQKKLAA